MNELEIILPGNVISKKNSRRCFGGKAVASVAFLAYEKEILQFIHYLLPIEKRVWRGSYPVELRCFFFRKTRAKFDYSNMIESIQDIFVKAGVIVDDDVAHVIPVVDTVNGIRGMAIDKDHPRVVVRLVGI